MAANFNNNNINTGTVSSSVTNNVYIYELPHIERQLLCAYLDDGAVWKVLAKEHMGYADIDVQNIETATRNGNSPSDELLRLWGDLNHTVTELFVVLCRVKQYAAMDAIKQFVNSKYHRLILHDRPDISNLLKNQTKTSAAIQGNSSDKILNGTRTSESDENNESSIEKEVPKKNNNVNEYASTIPQINYQELADATSNWNERFILGKGGFGTVYHGMWKFTQVAIKKIDNRTSSTEPERIQIQQSVNELRYLNSCRHDNILPLYGYSIGGGGDPCLVYQFMPGGSLEQRLFNVSPELSLSWTDRINVARGTARGLQYLHTFREKPLIHGDIKPGNILLDVCKQPKIGDFGLAREGPTSNNSTLEVSRVYGTKPYLPAEFIKYRSLSTKVDTYSFGIVLFELMTGLRAFDKNREHKFLIKLIHHAIIDDKKLEDLIDKSIPVDVQTIELCKILIKMGRICTSEKPVHRPEMVMVLWNLEVR